MHCVYYSTEMHPTYKIIHPYYQKIDGDSGIRQIKGWWIHDPPSGTFTKPNLNELSLCGWLQVFACSLFCWPCFFLPCFCSMNYEGYQIPDYV